LGQEEQEEVQCGKEVGQQLVEGGHQNGKTSLISAHHPLTTNKQQPTNLLSADAEREANGPFSYCSWKRNSDVSRHRRRSNCSIVAILTKVRMLLPSAVRGMYADVT
jgi:hypothetical protein